jgi:CHAT domain-containing protein
VGSVFAGREIRIHTTEEFDEESFIRDVIDADVLHVCAHATFDAQKEHESGISIGNGRFFDLARIAGLHLRRYSLVFLSACDTGTLDVSDRFNRVSITQSFLDSGAGSVIATQWKVDGRAMAMLSHRFYQLLLDPTCPSTIDALRMAQNWLRTSSTSELSDVLGQRLVTTLDVPYSDDFFWGAVTLWGSWV